MSPSNFPPALTQPLLGLLTPWVHTNGLLLWISVLWFLKVCIEPKRPGVFGAKPTQVEEPWTP